jgi:hypothetical protein
MPEAPPCTSSVSPGASRPRSKTFDQTVKKVSGSEAASTIDRPRGTGSTCTSGVTQYSA